MIAEFQNQNRFLSNFWELDNPIEYEGIEFYSVENAYQAAKCKHRKDMLKFVSMKPGEAKRAGKNIEIRDDWESVKLETMEDLVRQKFENNYRLARMLVDTYPNDLQEGNRWHDTYWGVDLNTGKGENHLGKILMKIRDEL